MNARKGNGIASHPAKNWDKLTELDNSDLIVTGRADLKVGDTLIQRIKGDGEGNKYISKKFKIIGETTDLYICRNHRFTECFKKVDYRYGLGLEKAN